MSLATGMKLASYEIISALGAGGMGEVYRARDTKLNRDVAIKVLLPAVANDPDRLARFSREAQVLASLNHPNIAHIHGLEEANGITALVMELVEGEDLSQRIARGAIPIDEALPIARQIAEALEAAHDHGIIHRDLKPANVKVRPDGTVKVLDFGLAKQGSGTGDQGSGAANSPTLSIHATQAGIILGTAAYMSPEQARGKFVDRRTDIWALGCVLFEMLTAQRAFPGDDATDTIVAVVSQDPDWSKLPSVVPIGIRRMLRRALEKDPRRRLDSASGARIEIDEALLAPSTAEGIAPPLTGGRSRSLRILPWAFAGALAIALTSVLVVWAPWRTAPPQTPLRLSAVLGAEVSLNTTSDAAAVSPDGTVVAFIAQQDDSPPQIYVRRLSQLQATALPGTGGASTPFFSPDGEWLAFFAAGKLHKITVTGGAAVTLCDASDPRGGAWGEDGTIVFLPSPRGTLMRVSSAGGTPEPLTTLATGEVSQRWPQILPGGKAVLFTSGGAGIAYDDGSLVVQALPTGARTVLQRGGYHGRYLPTAPGGRAGHLIYVHAGTLLAAPFDLDQLLVTGPPVPVLEGLTSNTITASAQFAVSAGGTLVYVPGHSNSGGWPIHWMDREGKTTALRATLSNWAHPHFSPGGQHLAMQISGSGPSDIWIYEWERDALTRLTFDAAADLYPVWTPDGRRIAFTSTRADPVASNLYWQRSDGAGDAQRLTKSKNFQQPGSWHPSGRFLAFEEIMPATASSDLMILPMDGDETSGWKPGTPRPFLSSPFQEREPMFSPDGRWLAYISNESGRDEIYVRPFPGPGGKWQVSNGGGATPTWSQARPELLYGVNRQIMAVTYAVEGDSFRADKPRLWSPGSYISRGNRMFDLHPGGTRVAIAPVDQPSGTKQDTLSFFFNFLDELRRIAPVAKQ